MVTETVGLRPAIESAVNGFSVATGRESFGFWTPREKPLIEQVTHPAMPRYEMVEVQDWETQSRLKRRSMKTFFLPQRGKLVAYPDYLEAKSPEQFKDDHNGSGSQYYIDMIYRGNRIYFSFLPAYEWTSGFHSHLPRPPQNDFSIELPLLKEVELGNELNAYSNGQFEYYEVVDGSGFIHHEEGDAGYPIPQFFRVNPGINHRIEAGPDGISLGLLTTHADLYKKEFQHLHVNQFEPTAA